MGDLSVAKDVLSVETSVVIVTYNKKYIFALSFHFRLIAPYSSLKFPE